MLFKTITEIKNHVPVNASFAFARISAFLSEVEQQIIIPLISQAQYDDINTAYNGAGCSSAQQLLLDKIQPPLANLAFALAAPSLIISVGEFGIHITSTEDKKTPFEWQLREWQSRLENAGNSALDTLLTFLETNKTTYTIWAGSTAYPEFKEFFINTTTQFDDVVNIRGSRRLFIALKQAMKRVEDFKILPVIGQEYFDELKTQNAANTTTAANLLALALIRKATAHFTIAFSIPQLPLTQVTLLKALVILLYILPTLIAVVARTRLIFFRPARLAFLSLPHIPRPHLLLPLHHHHALTHYYHFLTPRVISTPSSYPNSFPVSTPPTPSKVQGDPGPPLLSLLNNSLRSATIIQS